MSVYDDQAKELVRTPSALVTLGMRYCANWYAQQSALDYSMKSDDFGLGTVWTRSGATIGAYVEAPDGTDTAQVINFPANGDYIQNLASTHTAASKAYTESVWLRASAPGTITMELRDGGDTEGPQTQVSVTTTWTRFSGFKLFSGAAAGGVRIKLRRQAGDLAAVEVWRPNISRNIADANLLQLWPTVFIPGGLGSPIYAASCQAADAGDGNRCFYSFPTCQDRANFNAGNAYEATKALQGIREFRFCRQDTAIPLAGEDIRPHILSLDWAAQKIDPERAKTQNERIQIKMADDKGPGLWDQQKSLDGAKVNTALEAGSFWRRFRVIYRNFANDDCYAIVKRGFVASGMTEALYVQRGKYLITNIAQGSDGNFSLSCADRLKLFAGARSQDELSDSTAPTGAKGPPKISTTNVLTVAALAGDLTLNVTDASEFTPPGDGHTVTILIGTEKLNVTDRDLDANTLTVTRGRWGTVAAGYSIGKAISEIIEFGTERSSPGLTPLGKNPIDIVVEILRRGGAAAADIDTTTLYDERDTWLASSVDTATGTVSGTLFRRTLTRTTDYEKLLTELREILMLDLWVGEDQKITGRLFAPARPTVTLATLTDEANFIADSISIDENDESRITACLVAYDLAAGEDGKEIGDFQKGVMTVEPELESDAGYGRRILKVILSQWLQPTDSASASKLTAHYLGRYRQGARRVSASVELKDDARRCGDFVSVTTALLQDAFGATDTNRQMQIIKKAPKENGTIDLELIDADLLGKYGFIAPAGYPDWASATADQRRYGYIGSAGANQLGTGEEGFLIW